MLKLLSPLSALSRRFVDFLFSADAQLKLDEEKIPRLLLSFALPAMAGMIAGAVYNIVDRIFVGQFVGSDGLAAITICFPTMLLMFAFSLLFSVGGASRVSILRGARKQRPAEQALANAFMLLALVGVGGALFSLTPGIDLLLELSGASGKVVPLARAYLKIILLGGPFALVGGGINSLVRACGSPRYAMATQILGASANVVLDAFFISGLGMGVEGAAYGTVIAQAMATACGVGYFFTRRSALRLRLSFLLRPQLEVIKRIVSVGFSPFIIELSFVLFMTVMNRTIHYHGGDLGLSALGVFFAIDSLLFLPAMAIGEASQPIIGYNYGAGQPERVIKTLKLAIFGVTLFYICSFLLAQLFTEDMMRFFNDDPDLLALAVPGMRIGYVGIMFVGVPIVTTSALQGLGKARIALFMALFRHALLMFVPMLVLPRFFGIWGIWMSFPVGDVLGCAMSIIFLRWLIRWLRSPKALVVD